MLSYKEILKLSQENLIIYAKDYLETKYDKIYATKDYVIAVGDIPVGLVAHTDTVFGRPPRNIFCDKDYGVIWSPEGAGHDDRAGVYGILKLVEKGFKPTVILIADEERGCLGAEKLVMDFPDPPASLKYLIELDRQGKNDCVFYQCKNIPFFKFIESFGFITKSGSYSDISVLCPHWNLAGANLSVGYYNEHTEAEFLCIDQLSDTLTKTASMLQIANETSNFEYIRGYKNAKRK